MDAIRDFRGVIEAQLRTLDQLDGKTGSQHVGMIRLDILFLVFLESRISRAPKTVAVLFRALAGRQIPARDDESHCRLHTEWSPIQELPIDRTPCPPR